MKNAQEGRAGAAAFTPGPWHYAGPDGEDDDTASGGPPFSIYTHGDHGGVHAEVTTTEADARLIAAAPDTYSALWAIMEDLHAGRPVSEAKIRAGRAAIRKAQACGGDTGQATVGSPRMQAVSDIERLIEKLEQDRGPLHADSTVRQSEIKL